MRKKEPMAQTTPGRVGPPLHPRCVTLAVDWGVFAVRKKEPIPLSHTAGHHASSPMLQMGFKRGHTMWESWSALFSHSPEWVSTVFDFN